MAAASATEQQKPSTSSSISIASQSSDGYDNQDDLSTNDLDFNDPASDALDQEGSTRRKKQNLFSTWSRRWVARYTDFMKSSFDANP